MLLTGGTISFGRVDALGVVEEEFLSNPMVKHA